MPIWYVDLWPAEELAGWLAFSKVETMPDEQWGHAMIAHTIARVMGSYKGGIDGFIPSPEPPRPLSHKQLRAKLVIALGARKVDNGQAGQG